MKDDSVHFSVRTKVILFCLLITLALIFRYPTTPHEIGWDSFSVHLMANSVSDFGYAKWWLHPASIIGSYPYSTSPSAVPFLLSGISQCTSIDVGKSIFVYSTFLGIFSIFGAYLMAGAIWKNDIYKLLVAFIFSTSIGIVTFTTWTAHARTLFIIILPFFIYVLLRTRTFKVRNFILTSLILLLLLVTHHYIYFMVPIIISYFVIIITYKAVEHFKTIRISEKLVNFAMVSGFFIAFSIPYFKREIWWSDPEMVRAMGTFSIYGWISNVMLLGYVRYTGILVLFVIGGYFYLIFKRNKIFEEQFLLLSLAGLAPLLYVVTYMKFFILPFISLFIGIALTNIFITMAKTRNKKIAMSIIVLVLISSVIVSGYFQYLRYLNDPNPRTRFLEERTYTGGLWINNYIGIDNKMLAESYISHRTFSVSKVPTLTGVEAADLAYDFIDPKKIEVEQIFSPYSVRFYMNDPYTLVNKTVDVNTIWDVGAIAKSDINDPYSWAYRLTNRFNLSYYVENKDFRTTFSRSVELNRENLYDNGKIRVWHL